MYVFKTPDCAFCLVSCFTQRAYQSERGETVRAQTEKNYFIFKMTKH